MKKVEVLRKMKISKKVRANREGRYIINNIRYINCYRYEFDAISGTYINWWDGSRYGYLSIADIWREVQLSRVT